MRRNTAITIALLLPAAIYADGLSRLVSTNRTSGTGTLRTGAIFVATNSPVSLYVGNASSNAVLVGSDSWSNNVTAAVTNGLASTNYVNAAVSGLTTNLLLLDAGTNQITAYITNGLWKGVSQP